MKTRNAPMEEFILYINRKKVYLYGLGEVFQSFIKRDIYRAIHQSVAGYIDNGKAGQEICICGETCIVNSAESLRKIRTGIILICSTKQLDDMYESLCRLNLPDSVECFVLPLIWAVSDGKTDWKLKQLMDVPAVKQEQIPKRIHCFWLSGEEKPEDYRRCMASWRQMCPGYEVTEWDAQNYDVKKNKFMHQAYEKRKWAFVSDYARLDVVYRYGGIYLDMDVELLRSMDALLKWKAFFNFGTQYDIDLGSGFGSAAGNSFLKELMDLYENTDFCDTDGNPLVWKYVQPVYIREVFRKRGTHMDGSMQLVDGMLILPRSYFTPMDDYLSDNYVQTKDTIGIHHYNAGWCDGVLREQRKGKAFWKEVSKRLLQKDAPCGDSQ